MSIVRIQHDTSIEHHDRGGKLLPGRWDSRQESVAKHDAASRPTSEDAYALQARARQLQAQAVRDGTLFLARGVARGVRWLASTAASWLLTVGEALAAKRAYEELSRLSDHHLADMGLTRDDIPAVAWGRLRRDVGIVDAPETARTDDVAQRYRNAD
jgi:uncharacterized protein YjiS (DUF1127 family)